MSFDPRDPRYAPLVFGLLNDDKPSSRSGRSGGGCAGGGCMLLFCVLIVIVALAHCS